MPPDIASGGVLYENGPVKGPFQDSNLSRKLSSAWELLPKSQIWTTAHQFRIITS